MPSRLKKTLAVAGSFTLGGVLLYFALRDVDFAAVGEALRNASYGWLAPLLLATLAAHLLRAWRWQLLLETLPDEEGRPSTRVPLRLAFYSVMIGYMVNYAAPRAGEVARAANVASQTKLRFSAVFGTVVVERVLDAVVLLMALLSVAVLFHDRLSGTLSMLSSGMGEALSSIPLFIWVLVVAGSAGLAALGFLGIKSHRSRKAAEGPAGTRGVAGIVRSFRDGLASLLRSKRRTALAVSTAGIWFCYLLMADLPLRLFGFSLAYSLSLVDSWALLTVGAVGMSIPSPGGTGSFHLATVQTLVALLGVPETPAATYAIFSHAAQLVLMCVAGFVCLLLQGTSLAAIRSSPQDATGSSLPAVKSER